MSIEVQPHWWQTLFDDIYLITDARSVCDRDITVKEIDLVWGLLNLSTNHRILDLCGGHGRHSIELCRRGIKDCTLLDYSTFLIERAGKDAREQGVTLRCIEADARKTGLSSESFDTVIIMGNSLGYGENRKWDLDILHEAQRVLCTGGVLLVDVVDGSWVRRCFNPRTWHEIGDDVVVCRVRELLDDRVNVREIVLSRKRGLLRDQGYSIRYYNPSSMKELFTKAGLSDIQVHSDFSPHVREGDYGFMNNRMMVIGRKKSQ
jgi:D-alanine-D-alanine ligase